MSEEIELLADIKSELGWILYFTILITFTLIATLIYLTYKT